MEHAQEVETYCTFHKKNFKLSKIEFFSQKSCKIGCDSRVEQEDGPTDVHACQTKCNDTKQFFETLGEHKENDEVIGHVYFPLNKPIINLFNIRTLWFHSYNDICIFKILFFSLCKKPAITRAVYLRLGA